MQGRRKLGRGVAVVGAGMSKFGMFADKDSKYLFAEAFLEMRSTVDKGIDPNDIDALYLGNFTNDFFVHPMRFIWVISRMISSYIRGTGGR
jgi:acetyl-CoA acetyltransferase